MANFNRFSAVVNATAQVWCLLSFKLSGAKLPTLTHIVELMSCIEYENWWIWVDGWDSKSRNLDCVLIIECSDILLYHSLSVLWKQISWTNPSDTSKHSQSLLLHFVWNLYPREISEMINEKLNSVANLWSNSPKVKCLICYMCWFSFCK